MSWIHVIVGAAVLLFGRRLFWLFVAGTGFGLGALLAARLFGHETEWIGWAVAIGAGLLGIWLACFAQKVAVSLAGFLSGGYLGLFIASTAQANVAPWLAFAIGGIVGALLLAVLFNWALIALSSLLGAVLVTVGAGPALSLTPPASALLVLVLLCLGLAWQSRQLRRKTAKPEPPPKS